MYNGSGDSLTNHLCKVMTVILSSCSAGLQQSLCICSNHGAYLILKKSVIMIKKTIGSKKNPSFYLGDQDLNVVNKIKYLTPIIRDDSNDDDVQH